MRNKKRICEDKRSGLLKSDSKMLNKIFSDDWIRTTDLLNLKRPLYLLSQNHCHLLKIVSKFGLVKEFPLFHFDRFEGTIDGWMLQLETISVKAIERLFDSERKQFLQIQKANYH